MKRTFYFTPTEDYHKNMKKMQEAFHKGRFLIEEIDTNIFKLTDTEDGQTFTTNAQDNEDGDIASILTQIVQRKLYPDSLPDFYFDEFYGCALIKS